MAADYDKLQVLGSGTYGKAWLAFAKSNKKHCVLKEIKVSDMTKKEIDQTITEVTVLAKCKHENIIRYSGAYVEDGALFIAMEYAEGGDMCKKIIDQRGIHFPGDVILNWFVQINMALCYIHSYNILHRDLKPQNIFLTNENTIKLGDFGIARVLRDKNDLAMTVIGTPYYLSPEICQKQPYNYKSDMWALGCVLYELCCLRVPFSAPDFTSLVMAILSGSIEPIPRHYGPLLEDLVGVLLRTQPDGRPTAEQILCIPAMQPYVMEYTRNLHRTIGEKKRRMASPNIENVNPKKEKKDDCCSKKQNDLKIDKDVEQEAEMEVKDEKNGGLDPLNADVQLDENQNEVKVETAEKENGVCSEKQDGSKTPEKLVEMVEENGHKTPPRSKTPENCCEAAECYCVENPKKLRIEHTSPHMKDMVKKQRAAFSCEPGMKLNVGNQGIGPAPVFSLISAVRRPIRSESGHQVNSQIKQRPFSMAQELMARKNVGRSKSATRHSVSSSKPATDPSSSPLRRLSKSVDDLTTESQNDVPMSSDKTPITDKPVDPVFKSPGKPIDSCYKTPNRKSSHTDFPMSLSSCSSMDTNFKTPSRKMTDLRSVPMSLCSVTDTSFKTPTSKTSPTNMNDSGCSEDDVFTTATIGRDPTAITPAAGSQSTSGSCINTATFRVPNNKPRLSVPMVDLREENELYEQNMKMLFQATAESLQCKNKAIMTLTLYLQEKLGASFFQHLFRLYKETLRANDFEILMSRMRKSLIFLPLFTELMRIENLSGVPR